jgi:hypothetical protein
MVRAPSGIFASGGGQPGSDAGSGTIVGQRGAPAPVTSPPYRRVSQAPTAKPTLTWGSVAVVVRLALAVRAARPVGAVARAERVAARPQTQVLQVAAEAAAASSAPKQAEQMGRLLLTTS